MNTSVRRAVFARAEDRCEAIGTSQRCPQRAEELDHFFSRAKAEETAATCWALCRTCHHEKTNNRPSASFWLGSFIKHAERHGYTAEAERAANRLAFVEQRSAFGGAAALAIALVLSGCNLPAVPAAKHREPPTDVRRFETSSMEDGRITRVEYPDEVCWVASFKGSVSVSCLSKRADGGR